MKEQEITNLKPQLPKPTEEEIVKATNEFKVKFGKELTKTDAVKYATLRNGLGYWLTVEKEYEKNGVTRNMAKEAQEFLEKKCGKDVTMKQAYLEAEKSLLTAIMLEKVRINDEIKGLIDQ